MRMRLDTSKLQGSPISAVDLFCGAGGLTHGLLRAGIRVEAGIDVDPAAAHAYATNNAGARFPGEHPGVDVEHHMRRDRPDYWTVSGERGGIWSYDLNVARTSAAALLGAPVLTIIGETNLEAHHAYVPLPLARPIAVIGAGLPGPTPEGSYPRGSSAARTGPRVLRPAR